MTFKFPWLASLAIAVVSIAAQESAHSGMVISYNDNTAEVKDSLNGVGGSDGFSSNTFPTHHLVDATAGSYYSRIQLDYTESSGGTTLSSVLTQNKGGAELDFSIASSSTSFTVTADTTYNLSGAFNVHDLTTSGQVFFLVELYDATNGVSLFFNRQESLETVNQSFVVGGTNGDFVNLLSGSLSGNLIAGNSYGFSWTAFISSYPDANSETGAASADGNFLLTLGNGPSAVPEPGSIIVWSLSAIGVVLARRKRTHQP